ncbi:MAG: GGDEF domain-containing protein [Deltaproteobacteria bacterium]
MRRDPLDDAPPVLARRVRTASVPAFLRALCLHLPATLTVDAVLPTDPARVTDTACRWIKLARTGTRVETGAVSFSSAPGARVVLTIHAAGRAHTIDDAQLAGDFAASLEHVFAVLFASADHAATLRAFAFQSSVLATLHKITQHMLATGDVAHAAHIMLSGVTSGYGLGFHRAAVFVPDPQIEGAFRGFRAIGPSDDDDAHRIWEQLELEDRPIDDLIDPRRVPPGESPFERRVRDLVLRPTGAPDDEVTAALAATAPCRFRGTLPSNPGLAALAPDGDFVLAAVRPQDRVLALVYADHAFGGAAVVRAETEHLFGIFVDQTGVVWDHLRLLEQVEHAARFDALTGIANRREFQEKLAQGARQPCSLLILDVDHFKRINDTSGHAAGDAALRALAEVLVVRAAGDALPARIGGDEFAVLLPGIGPGALAAIADALGADAVSRGLSVSIGGATWPDHVGSMSELTLAADAQLYRAKDAGRGRAALPGLEPTVPGKKTR